MKTPNENTVANLRTRTSVATEYTVNHLGLDPSRSGNVSLTYCGAGHMLYTKKSCLDGLSKSMTDF
jgi:hypothetical protein